ncbi:MAG: putative biotin-requiring protein [Bacteriovoracaceae bacterium]|nr:putative biotin-requiring protein [Bacteriovoracaceae bacterium]
MRWRLKTSGSEDPIEVTLLSKKDEEYTFKVGEEIVTIENPEVFPFSIKTKNLRLSFETWTSKKWKAISGSETYTIEPLAWGSSSQSSQGEILSEMPGRILKLLVKVGEKVSENQPLLIMEAMKMENEIRATGNSIVKSIAVQQGQSVESGTLLLELEANK